MAMEILIALLLGAVIIFQYWKTRKFKVLETIPGPKPYPIVGSALMFNDATYFLPKLCECIKQYGDTVLIWIGPNLPNVISIDYKFVETLLCSTKNLHKSWQYNYFHKWLGRGLLTSETVRWKKHRKILTPAFHFQILVKFVNMFERSTAILIRKLEKNIGAPSFNIFTPINLYSLDVMCETSMGTIVDAQENEESDYVNAVREMGRIVIERSFSALKINNFIYKFTSDYRKEIKALKILHGYTESVIKKRRKEMEKENEDYFSSSEKPTFLDILLLSKVDGESLSDEVIREEVDTFMFEGHDTTSAGVSFALYCIANHPDVQKKAIEEQVQIFGQIKNPNVQYSDLQNMKYLELIIKESLRLYPPVPIYGRELVEDMIIDGQLYPRGLNCYILAYAIQRDEKFFPNPDEFNPSRFLEMGSENPFANIPFSAGQRNCIGQKFAMMEAKYVISALLRNFELCPAQPNEKPFLVAETILRSHNGIKISIKERSF